MRLSRNFTKTQRNIAQQIESKNAQLFIQAGYIKQELSGIYTFLPLGLKVLNKIENIVRSEMDKIGVEVLMPALSNSSSWKKTKRLDSVDVLFKADGANKLSQEKNSKFYVLNSTHEEIVTPLVQSYVHSYKDLPVSVYQIQTKFRNEERAKSGLLRGREFRMKDLYSFHVSEADLLNFYEKVKVHYMNIFEKLGIGNDTFITHASGGDFTTEYSHEFQTLLDTGEDTIYLDRKNNIAYNKEIVTPKDEKKLGVNFSELEQVTASEVGNIFPLNTKFSNAFNFTYIDDSNKSKPVYMGCYGIGTSRVMGILAEKFSDEKGLVWPVNIAPAKYHIIPLFGEKTVEISQKVYEELGEVNCLFDDRNNVKNGEKFSDAELIGCPICIVISKKTLNNDAVEVSSRNGSFETFLCKLSDIDSLNKKIDSLLANSQDD